MDPLTIILVLLRKTFFLGGGERRVLPKNDIISDLYRLFRGSVMPFNNCP